MTHHTGNTRINQVSFGEPKDVLVLEHLPFAPRDSRHVRVRIEAANINPSDLLSIHGVGQYRRNHQPPRVPGFEAVGHVVESDCPRFISGQKVLVAAQGTWQKYTDVHPDNLFHLPSDIDNGYAAQLYINAFTAWVLTTEVAKLTPNDVVIINAGSSAIGKIFAQLSSTLGFTLIAITSRPESYPYPSVSVFSAHENLAAQIKQGGLPQPNVALDAIGGPAGTELIQTLGAQGRYITYGTLSLAVYEKRFFEYQQRQQIQFSNFFLRYWEDQAGKAIRREKFEMMLKHFLSNKIALDVDQYAPLEQFQLALKAIENHRSSLKGKVILTM
ncbi:zinc-dependent alcohol dehydrogenase family protein [Photobacterium galatheae]|uniref:Alcohol dehydrogenase n=1 Tax=Photobacterium galatheae TaxID=1654360 RepID=A0A066RR42_9GAMM|nr:zinc-dependent alcohol dehydrogenase family protein [Photobacterium galatheae]KDM92920.1 alcohol dehydrogenase [Photobacterium galatheae]MCM0148115.1 zinc-dependent alcohol dehydrogenase family protein [Photobacterium galatheae]